MRLSHLGVVPAVAALVLAATAPPLAGQLPRSEKADLRLALDRTAYAPGGDARLAAVMELEAGWHANSHRPTFDYLIPTELEVEVPAGWAAPEIVYPEGEMKSFGFSPDPISVYDGQAVITARLRVPESASAGIVELAATLRYQACDDRSCLPPVSTRERIELTVGGGGEAANEALFAGSAEAGSGGAGSEGAAGGEPAAPAPRTAGLALMLLLAFVGGLILNAMPCVLPVLSLKLLGLVKSAGGGRRQVVTGSLATTAGILLSFWALAGAAVAARAAGAAVGWGVQFQEPLFVTFLAVVVVLFCLNLWGLFEIPLPAFVARSAGRAGAGGGREGLTGHLASGLFATLMATPCSAPFLGTAIGFALAQSAGTIGAIFTAVGVGMASPYLVLAVAPRAASALPRPGPWMEKLKVSMGFLLAGAAIWLFYVLAAQVSAERLAFIELALLALALFVWLRQRGAAGRLGRRLAAAGILLAAGASLLLAARAPEPSAAAAPGTAGGEGRIEWTRFDEERARGLADEGRLVFVDVTADWCFTCKVNERLVLEREEIAAAFERHGVVAMKADWTNRDDEITEYLASHGRGGIPFYALYAPGRDEPHVFGELLTRGEVLRVLSAAAEEATAHRSPRESPPT